MGGKDRLDLHHVAVAAGGAPLHPPPLAHLPLRGWSRKQADEPVTAAAWSIVHPDHNRQLAETAVRDTGLGNVADKMAKNRRKTIGLLDDLRNSKSVGVIAELPELGLTEIARPVGVVAAVTPSTNPGATPANNIINALKGRNALLLAPSPNVPPTR